MGESTVMRTSEREPPDRERALARLAAGTAGIHLAALIDTAAAVAWVRRQIFPDHPGPQCPCCRRTDFSPKFIAGWGSGLQVQCPGCKRRMSWRTGTPFRASSLGPGQAVVLLAGLQAGVPRPTLAQWVGVCKRTIENWAVRLRAAAPTTPDTAEEAGTPPGPLFGLPKE